MKIIQGLKQIKDLSAKAHDIGLLIQENCAIDNITTPKYGTVAQQRKKVDGWLQAYSDILKEILKIRIQIQKTNLATFVDIELDGKIVTKTIAEWIHRRRDLANDEFQVWSLLSDRGIKEGRAKNASGDEFEVKLIRFYDPDEKDAKMALFKSEPGIIDATLEVTNAVTDLLE